MTSTITATITSEEKSLSGTEKRIPRKVCGAESSFRSGAG